MRWLCWCVKNPPVKPAVGVWPGDLFILPRELAELLYNVQQFTVFARVVISRLGRLPTVTLMTSRSFVPTHWHNSLHSAPKTAIKLSFHPYRGWLKSHFQNQRYANFTAHLVFSRECLSGQRNYHDWHSPET
jgi:hypothetical protein